MNTIGAQVGSFPNKIVVSITQDTLPAGASDHFYLSLDGGLLVRPERIGDVVLASDGHTTIELPVPFQGQLCSVTAWREFSDGSEEQWELADPPAYFYWDNARFHTIRTDYYSPAYEAPWTTVDSGEFPNAFKDDFREGLRHWVNEYGWTNSQHRMVDETTPEIINVPVYRHTADLNGDPDYDGVPPYATEVNLVYEDGGGNQWHDWTVPSHDMRLLPATGWTDGKRGLAFHNTGLPRVDSFSPAIVPTVSLDPKQDWEIEVRRWDGGDVFKGETAAGYEDCIIVSWGGEFLYEYVGWLTGYGRWGVYKAVYHADTREIDFYSDGVFVRKHIYNEGMILPEEYVPRKPHPDLPVKLWLAASTDVIESVTLRGRIPYYWACDAYEFRDWDGFGDTFSIAWGSESYWDDPLNHYGMANETIGNYSQAGGITPKAPTPMFPTGWNWTYAGYPVPESTNILDTGVWGATSPRFHASSWTSLRYLARRGNGSMTIKVVDADTQEVLVSSTPPVDTPNEYTTLDLTSISGDTVLQVIVEGNNTTTDYNLASRLFSLEIDAESMAPPSFNDFSFILDTAIPVEVSGTGLNLSSGDGFTVMTAVASGTGVNISFGEGDISNPLYELFGFILDAEVVHKRPIITSLTVEGHVVFNVFLSKDFLTVGIQDGLSNTLRIEDC